MANKENLIWYVCYGSNLVLERFMCYLTGEGSDKYGIKPDKKRECADKREPRDSKVFILPYEIYFAGQSRNWEYKSPAFIDVNKPNNTYARAYLITEEQFNHVKKWENGGKENIDRYNSWYGYDQDVASPDDKPAKTLTSYRRRKEGFHGVSDKYLDAMRDGLREMEILSDEEIEGYLRRIVENSRRQK